MAKASYGHRNGHAKTFKKSTKTKAWLSPKTHSRRRGLRGLN